MAVGSDAAAALYVVGLPADAAEESVKGIFCVHGAVASVKMLPPNAKKPLGAAFVFFESAESAKSALSAQWAPPLEVVAKNAGWEAASEDGAVHVTGLPASCDDATVNAIFAKFGTVKSAKVLKATAERSDVAAIVCMSSAEEAKTLIDTVSGTTPDGLSAPIGIKAKLPSRRWAKGWGKGWGGWGGGWGRGTKSGLSSFPADKKVWLGDLPEGTTVQELREYFGGDAKAKFAVAMSGKGAGTGGVAFATAEDATSAIATLNGSTFKGSQIVVDVWTKKEAAPAAPTSE